MGDVVSLNQYRKQREKALKARKSVENRAVFGLNKDERAAARNEQERQRADLEGKKLERGPSDEPPRAS